MAALTLMAFSNASRVMIFEGRASSPTMATMRRPARWAITKRWASTAGIAASRELHPERFRHASHGGGRAHGHAVTVASVHATLGFREVCGRHAAVNKRLLETPDVST